MNWLLTYVIFSNLIFLFHFVLGIKAKALQMLGNRQALQLCYVHSPPIWLSASISPPQQLNILQISNTDDSKFSKLDKQSSYCLLCEEAMLAKIR